MNTYSIGSHINSIVHFRVSFVAIITITKAIKEKNIFTRAAIDDDRGKTYFGTYIFLMSDELDITAFIAVLVASELYSNMSLPHMRYMGKFSILFLKIVEKTMVSTTIVSRGLRRLHKRPR